jgi:hypothetical protein
MSRVASYRLDSSYIAEYEKVLQKTRHLQLVSSKIFTIDGVPAYENIQRLGEAPFASVKVDHQIMADGRFYELSSVVIGGDATKDSELQEGLASFHFLQPPKASSLSNFGMLDSFRTRLIVLGIIIIGITFWVMRSRKI